MLLWIVIGINISWIVKIYNAIFKVTKVSQTNTANFVSLPPENIKKTLLKTKALFNWSSGKDSALALYKILQNPEFEIACLLTSVYQQFQRISMHGVRVELLEQQAKSIGLPFEIMQIPKMPTMEVYEKVMKATLTKLKKQHFLTEQIF